MTYNNRYVPRNLSICTKMYQSLSSYASSIHNNYDGLGSMGIDLSRVCVCVCVYRVLGQCIDLKSLLQFCFGCSSPPKQL